MRATVTLVELASCKMSSAKSREPSSSTIFAGTKRSAPFDAQEKLTDEEASAVVAPLLAAFERLTFTSLTQAGALAQVYAVERRALCDKIRGCRDRVDADPNCIARCRPGEFAAAGPYLHHNGLKWAI
jgi:hypothetical protein